MAVLWSSKEALASEQIIEKLGKEQSWSEGTVRSLLSRLVKKGAVETEREGRRYLYRANCDKSDCLKRESSAFLEHYFGGKLAPMMACFLGDGPINEDELDELENLIRERRRKSE